MVSGSWWSTPDGSASSGATENHRKSRSWVRKWGKRSKFIQTFCGEHIVLLTLGLPYLQAIPSSSDGPPLVWSHWSSQLPQMNGATGNYYVQDKTRDLTTKIEQNNSQLWCIMFFFPFFWWISRVPIYLWMAFQTTQNRRTTGDWREMIDSNDMDDFLVTFMQPPKTALADGQGIVVGYIYIYIDRYIYIYIHIYIDGGFPEIGVPQLLDGFC